MASDLSHTYEITTTYVESISFLTDLLGEGTYLLTDRHLRELYLENVVLPPCFVLEHPGEWNKSLATAEKIWDHMISLNLPRSTVLIGNI